MSNESNTIERLSKVEMKIDGVLANICEISETLKEMKDIQIDQVKLDGKIKAIGDKIDSYSKSIIAIETRVNHIENNGTKVCSLHNAQFEKMFGACKADYKTTSLKIDELCDKMRLRDRVAISMMMIFASGIIGLFFKILER
jgi:hypothetical protein